MGTKLINAAATIYCSLPDHCPAIDKMPIGNVKFSFEVKKIAGANISFHFAIKVNTASVAKVGLHIGRKMRQ
ncbi:hypothetical protein D3C73_1529330 [compost metagenome]